MSGILVLTDTASALPPDLAGERGIRLVPVTVTIGGRAYADEDLRPEDLLSAEGVTTSGPPPGGFLERLGDATAAVIVTVAEKLSSTYAAATVAGQLATMPVEVVDSMSAAAGQALVALAAAEAAAAGGDLDAVVAAACQARDEVRLVGCLESLDRLARSGRVPGIAGSAVRRLGIRPLFELRGGVIRPLRPAGSTPAALERMAALCVSSAPPSREAEVIVLDADAPESSELLLARVRARVPVRWALTTSFGSAMIAHAGRGAVGLAWRWR